MGHCYRCEGLETDGQCIRCGADLACGACRPSAAAWHMLQCEEHEARWRNGGGCAASPSVLLALVAGSYPRADREAIRAAYGRMVERRKG